MKQNHHPPEYMCEQFHCAYCDVYSSQSWGNVSVWINDRGQSKTFATKLEGSFCVHCEEWSFWLEQKMVIPSKSSVEPPHQDLPENCMSDYLEARDVFTKSPRAAAALLRLCVQNLMIHLSEKGENINDDIGKLVKKGLPPLIQKSLDICRVAGNHAVHPGQIDLNDSPQIVLNIFGLINMIVEDRITKPNKIKSMYDSLPEKDRNAIKKRDGQTSNES